eukprot:TRINITY_DN9860_c0_g2_i1.p2 TRINITY_DN9860_c0_g2~~TRINITY_DN9860_c0_g2_i1.p2  ORF type:complete len:741 (+),score=314.85 TRINITY_DN9860_c0_g2_i1:98-2320(+)
MNVRTSFKDAKRVMIKVGSNVLTNEQGRLSIGRIGHIVEQIASLVSQHGKEVILVSSGAVAVGKRRLDFQRRLSTSFLQSDRHISDIGNRAAASAGQAAFMSLYEQMFAQFDLMVGNVLLTHADLSSPKHIQTFSNTIDELLSCSIIPVLNENDVTNQKLENMPSWFVDNDSLSAKLATDLDAQLLLLLTDVPGLYTGPPGEKGSFLLDYYSPAIDKIRYGEASSRGRGGMESKIRAASLASQRGVDVIIASGFEKNVVDRIFEGEVMGTVFTDKWESQALTPRQVCMKGKSVTKDLVGIDGPTRSELLRRVARGLTNRVDEIIRANEADVEASHGKASSVTAEQILGMTNSFEVLARMEDPVDKVVTSRLITEGLRMERVTTPLGLVLVLGDMIEVLLQVVALCLRTGNSLLYYDVGNNLRQTHEATLHIIREAVGDAWPTDAIQYLGEETDLVRLVTQKEDFIDLILPRGDPSLVQQLRETTRIPILGVCESVCHVYVDTASEAQKAIDIVLDSKNSEMETGCNRGVANLKASSNAMDTLLVHEDLAKDGRLLEIIRAMRNNNIDIVGGPRASAALGLSKAESLALEYGSESKATIEIVSDVHEAIHHIATYGSSLADAIITTDDATAETFLREVDSACVFQNASTRFADGYRLGIGAETGVSAKRVHSGRGPVGVKGLLTSRMVIRSDQHHTTKQEVDGNWAYLHTTDRGSDESPSRDPLVTCSGESAEAAPRAGSA